MPTNPSKVERLDISDLEEDLQKSIQAMDEIQNSLDELTEKASVEILVVEQKYNKLRKPHYKERNEIIKKIPGFWAQVFANHPQVSAILSERDDETLSHLESLEVEEFEDIKSGYKISFHFKSNPFFENDVLVKEFHISDENGSSKSTPIQWKPGKNFLSKSDVKAGTKRTKDDLNGPSSFLGWYSEPAEDGICEIGESFKDDIWPNPLQYYLNEVNDSMEDEEFDEDGEDGEEEDGVEGEEEEDENEADEGEDEGVEEG